MPPVLTLGRGPLRPLWNSSVLRFLDEDDESIYFRIRNDLLICDATRLTTGLVWRAHYEVLPRAAWEVRPSRTSPHLPPS